jgi:hypothetical protein
MLTLICDCSNSERVALPTPRAIQNMDIVIGSRSRFVQAARPGDDKPDDVGRRVIHGRGPCIPQLWVESGDAKSANDTISNPDEARNPEKHIVLALEDRHMTSLC